MHAAKALSQREVRVLHEGVEGVPAQSASVVHDGPVRARQAVWWMQSTSLI
jgi:hypothetical protein